MSIINLADLTAEQIAELASKLKENCQSEKEKRAAIKMAAFIDTVFINR